MKEKVEALIRELQDENKINQIADVEEIEYEFKIKN